MCFFCHTIGLMVPVSDNGEDQLLGEAKQAWSGQTAPPCVLVVSQQNDSPSLTFWFCDLM